VFVDEAFLVMLKKKFGAVKWAKMRTESRHAIIKTEWEHMIKPGFDGSEASWRINIPWECLDVGSLMPGGEYPTISLDEEDVREAFDPTVEKIRAMVEEQVAAVRAKKGTNPKVRTDAQQRLCSFALTVDVGTVYHNGWGLRQIQVPFLCSEERSQVWYRASPVPRFRPV
jgi:hypothetical protein